MLLYRAGMRTVTRALLILLSALVLIAPRPALAQQTDPPDGTQITSAQVSGLELAKLSPGLQEEIAKLTGTPLDRAQVRALAARIEAEQPRYVAAVRITADPAGGARVVIVVARMRDPEHQANINVKYNVEDIRIEGVPDSKITAELRTEMQAMKGKPFEPEQADRLEARLRATFPDYDVSRRTTKGDQTGQVTVVFELERSESSRWLRFEPNKSHATYHSDQGWGAFADIPMGNGDVRVTALAAMDTTDDLVEEYSGLGIRFEARKIGTERLGTSLEYTWYEPSWRNSTLAALSLNPNLPRRYDTRTTFTPMASFAITQHLRISGGVSIAELDPFETDFDAPFGSSMANAAVGSIGYSIQRQEHKGTEGPWHEFEAAFTARSGMKGLESDYIYTRSLGQAQYKYEFGDHQILVSGMAGVINGTAPLFERFTLGDARTLRGWDKYDIAPAGGDSVAYGSVEYRFHVLTMFLDSGSVWNQGQERKLRLSTGVGVAAGPFFMTVGIPINTDNLRAVFTIGIRFNGLGLSKY